MFFLHVLAVNTGSLDGITLEILNASSTDVVQKVSFNKSDTSFSVANLTNAVSTLTLKLIYCIQNISRCLYNKNDKFPIENQDSYC